MLYIMLFINEHNILRFVENIFYRAEDPQEVGQAGRMPSLSQKMMTFCPVSECLDGA